jgi:hypothetical protein
VADPWLGAALVAPFGAARALGVLLSHRADPEDVLERLYAPRMKDRARVLNGVVLAVVALVAVAALA